MGRVEANLADLKYTIRHHTATQGRYLHTLLTFTERGSEHAANPHNPHGTTKDDVGLSELENYPIATNGEVINSSITDRYVDGRGAEYMAAHQVGSRRAFDPVTPIAPLEGDTVTTTRPTFQASGYRNRYGIHRRHRQIRIVHDTLPGEVIIQANRDTLISDVDLPPTGVLTWQVRDVSLDGASSPWTTPQSVTMAAPYTPTPSVALMDGDPNSTSMTPGFEIVDFPLTAVHGVHNATRWRLYVLTPEETLVWSSLEEPGHTVSISLPLGVVVPGSEYMLEVEGIASETGRSPTATLGFRVAVHTTPPPTILLEDNPQLTPLTPSFSLTPFPQGVDVLEEIQCTLYEGANPLWARTYTEVPSIIMIQRRLDYGTTYHLKVRWRGRYYGWSPLATSTFTTLAGGARGFVGSVQQPYPGNDGVWCTTPSHGWVESGQGRTRHHKDGKVQWRTMHQTDHLTRALTSTPSGEVLGLYIPPIGDHRLLMYRIGINGHPDGALCALEDVHTSTLNDPVFHGVWDDVVYFSALSITDNHQGVILATYRLTDGVLNHIRLTLGDDTILDRSFFTALSDEWFVGLDVTYLNTQGDPQSYASGVGRYKPSLQQVSIRVAHYAPGATPTAPQSLGSRVISVDPVYDHITITRGDECVTFDNSLTLIEWTHLKAEHPSGYELPLHVGMGWGWRPPVVETAVGSTTLTSAGILMYSEDSTPIALAALCSPTDHARLQYGDVIQNQHKAVMTLPDTPNRYWYLDDIDYETLRVGEVFSENTAYQWTECPVTFTLMTGGWPDSIPITLQNVASLDPKALHDTLLSATQDDPTPWGTLTYTYD